MTAHLVEIFSSIQGESELIGYRQIFLRFFRCNLRCAYCDSPETLAAAPPPACRVERTPGRGDCDLLPNPLAAADLCRAVAGLNRVPHHSVSLTGGEPLLHAPFLEAALPELRALGLRVYLETNGTLPHPLRRLLPFVDTIGMDVKLPSVTGPARPAEPGGAGGARPFAGAWAAHREFLEVARQRQVFVKVVVGAETPAAEVVEAALLVASVDPAVPVTLQPVTPFGDGPRAPSAAQLLDLQAAALAHLATVRVIPQAHRMLGVL